MYPLIFVCQLSKLRFTLEEDTKFKHIYMYLNWNKVDVECAYKMCMYIETVQ